jgi:thiol-disulfide isomerase/thioredoxin
VDDVTARIAVLVAVLVLASALGWWARARAGRTRRVEHGEVLTGADLGAELGTSATYLQLSSPACAPCRSVARVLSELATDSADLRHVEIDATERLDLAKRLSVLRTPTVLVLDPAGRVVNRFSGPATREQALAALPEPAVPASGARR